MKNKLLPLIVGVIAFVVAFYFAYNIMKPKTPSAGTGSTGGAAVEEDITAQYAKIKSDFIAIKDAPTVAGIEKVTGIKPTVIKDGEKSDEYTKSYEYQFDYGYNYEAYIKIDWREDKRSIKDFNKCYIEVKCPDEVFENSALDMNALKKDEFGKVLNRGLKVSGMDNYAGGSGMPNKYETSYENGKAFISSMIWADKSGNYIKGSLSSSTQGAAALETRTITFASYNLVN